jgi:branched-chain amino acid transport system substrate-binding protein
MYYCFNCDEQQAGNININNLVQKICSNCKQKSFQIGEFYAVKIVKNDDKKIKYFVAHKFGDPADEKYFVKPIYLQSSSSQSLYETLETKANFVVKKSGNELKEVGRIERERLDCVPFIKEVYYNESWIYVISQFVEGKDLRAEMANKKSSLNDITILTIFKEIAVTVKKVHEKGIVHGDIKPENIIYTTDNKIFLVDPVIAKNFNEFQYIPKKEIAYFPPELDYIFDIQNSNTSYQNLLRKHHDLYSLSALFVKILSNSIDEDRYFRNDAKKWHWHVDLNGLEDSKKINTLKDLLNRLVNDPGFRKDQNVDKLIELLESSKPNIILSKLSNVLTSCLEAVLSLPVLKTIGDIYNHLPPFIRENKFVKWIFLIVAILLIGDLAYKSWQPSLPPEDPGQSSSQVSNSERISSGDKILVRQEIQDSENQDSEILELKERGRRYFSEGKYPKAHDSFKEALIKYKNAPETRIYYNNAAIGSKQAYSIAVIVRSNEKPQDSLKILRGVAQAQDEFNEQQEIINSTPLKVVIVNDDDKEAVASEMAKAIADRKEILGVIGHYSSNSTIAAGKVYNERKLVAISATSTSDEITTLGPYVFRTVHKDNDAAKILADYTIIKNKWNNVAVIYDSNSKYSKSLKSAFVKNIENYHSAKIVDTIDIFRDINYIKKVQKLSSENTQALMLALPGTKSSYLFPIAKNKGKMNLLGGDDLYTIDLLKNMQKLDLGGKSVENPNGMVLAVPWTIDKNKTTKFVENSQNLWGGAVDWQTAMAYDAAQSFIQAIKENPKATRENIREALSNSKFIVKNGTTQKFKFHGQDRDNTVRLVQIQKSLENRSGTGYDFVEIDR